MNQKIFTMNLGVETVSLYLLCCAIADTGSPITHSALQDKWNGSSEGLAREIASLEKRNIIYSDNSAELGETVYYLMKEKHWR
jgi:hypothetical protein